MRVPGFLIILGVLFIGAVILAPAIAYFDFPPLPGDFHFNWGTHRVFMPLAQGMIVSVALGLFYLWAKK